MKVILTHVPDESPKGFEGGEPDIVEEVPVDHIERSDKTFITIYGKQQSSSETAFDPGFWYLELPQAVVEAIKALPDIPTNADEAAPPDDEV
jgi:hypothetical protein